VGNFCGKALLMPTFHKAVKEAGIVPITICWLMVDRHTLPSPSRGEGHFLIAPSAWFRNIISAAS
jgi:hypothetical protein